MHLQQSDKNSRKQTGNLPVQSYGYIPPQAIDLERAILGSLLLEKDAILTVLDILKSGMFYNDAHNRIFDAIQAVHSRGIRPDILVVIEELKCSDLLENVGGPYYISRLTNEVVSTANLEEHCRIIYQTFCARQIIEICNTLTVNCYQSHAEVFDLMDMASESFYFLQEQIFNKGTKDFGTILLQQNSEYDKPPAEDGVTGIASGFHRVDEKGHGWQPTDFVILAARPSMGKSALAGEFAFRPAYLYKAPVLLFSLEMSAAAFVNRIVSSRTKVFMTKISTRRFSDYDRMEIKKMIEDTHQTPLYINDHHSQTLQSICSESRKMVRKYGIKIIIIDYLQLIALTKDVQKRNGNRDQDLGIITNGLKQLAKELEVTVIALSQLSRATEKSDSKRPMLSHLRESGNIEQDADIVMFLHRPYYYVERENPGQIVDPAMKRNAELIYAKHRNGELGVVPLLWMAENAAFLEDEDFTEVQYF